MPAEWMGPVGLAAAAAGAVAMLGGYRMTLAVIRDLQATVAVGPIGMTVRVLRAEASFSPD